MQFLVTTNRSGCWIESEAFRIHSTGSIDPQSQTFSASRSPSSVSCEEKQKNLYSCRTITNSTSTLCSTANHRTHHLINQSCNTSKNRIKAQRNITVHQSNLEKKKKKDVILYLQSCLKNPSEPTSGKTSCWFDFEQTKLPWKYCRTLRKP